jgi:hypothetical protein
MIMVLNKFIASVFVFMTLGASAQAQITDDQLKKYAIAMDSIETLKSQLTSTLTKVAKGNSKISAERYTTLVPIANDAAKLAEAKATPEEIAYMKQAVITRNEETIKFQKAFQSLVSEYVGDTAFGKIRSALKTDTVLQKKYTALTKKLH